MGDVLVRRTGIFISRLIRNVNLCRRSASNVTNENRVVSSSDGQVIVCWHPDSAFPYELSTPIDKVEKINDTSVLKIQSFDEASSLFSQDKEQFVRQKLMDVTFTTKHRWFPKSIHKRRRMRPIDRNRPYL